MKRYFTIVVVILTFIFIGAPAVAGQAEQAEGKLEMGRVHKPLPYRIVSFHRAEANKDLIKLAHRLGFNGVMFQQEGWNVDGLKRFAANAERENYIGLCHELGMEVTVWIHELSQIPEKDDPDYLGPVAVDNDKLWSYLEDRYDWVLGELLPDIDGLVLTVVETQIRATDSDLMLKLVSLLQNKCEQYNKKLIVRTFTWHPEELEGVLGCVRRLPEDTIIMTKCVPQDWQMRGIHHPALGNVGPHPEIVEYDIAGEYFLLDSVANCMPRKLKRHFDYGLEKGVDGICVRVDRWHAETIYTPQEFNLWAMGMFASGKTDSIDEVWRAWAKERYGEKAAPMVIKALKPAEEVITEMFNVGSFTFGNGRDFPPHVDGRRSAFHTNWANWRWDKSFLPEYKKARIGDPEYVAKIKKQKAKAFRMARKSMQALKEAKDSLPKKEYRILRTKLWSNKVHLAYRARMMLAYLQYRRIENTDDPQEKQQLAEEIRNYLKTIREIAEKDFPPHEEIQHRGKTWKVGAPLKVEQDKITEWADKMETFLKGKNL